MPTVKKYRSRDGAHLFTFRFVEDDAAIDVFCLAHPSLNGRDPHPARTHLFESRKICFVAGREPRDLKRAEHLAAQWAEYFLRYRRTGVVES
ncbi:MAG: hypothetical protein JWM57_3892 [Phycisphaerales bacterium]|nr:hypothetical protein [Phycisphaerales bacterium]